MSNFWTTLTHTAGGKLKSKAFIITTVIMSILIIALFNLNNIIDNFSNDESAEMDTVAVLDHTTGDSENAFGEMLESIEGGTFNYVNSTINDIETAIEIATEEDSEFDYVLLLSGDMANVEAEFYGEGTDFRIGLEVNQEVQRIKETLVTTELNLNEEELAMIFNPVSFSEHPLREDGELQTQESHMQAYWMVYGLVFAIYMIVIMFGSMIATEVATEKSSRVMELIVSSISPVTQMAGKILGIGLAGLVNLIILIGAVWVGSYMSGEDFLHMIFTEIIDYSLIIYALVFIILGYFVYGGIAAMLGALVSRAEEVNQAIQPLVFLAVIALVISMYGLNAPDTTFIQILSYVPFFTPQLLFLRIGMGTVPVWEIVLIISILITSAILINLLAARIYKGGVLMYGKFSFRNGIKQAFKISKKES